MSQSVSALSDAGTANTSDASAATGAHAETVLAAADLYVTEGQPNRNHGREAILELRSAGRNRTLIAFDQASIDAILGHGALVSATLELTITDAGNNWTSDGGIVDIHRLLQRWTEDGATWNCAYDTDTCNSKADCIAGYDWDMDHGQNLWLPTATNSVSIHGGQSGVVQFNVTDDIRAFRNGALANDGWIIKKRDEADSGAIKFASRTMSQAPRLILAVNDACVPITCASAGAECGALSDGCGNALSCGACLAPDTCGVVAPNHCSLPPLAPSADTYVAQGESNQSHGGETILRLKGDGQDRALLQFSEDDIAASADGGVMFGARLVLPVSDNGRNWGPTGREVGLHQMMVPWTETGATWNCANDTQPANHRLDCATDQAWDMPARGGAPPWAETAIGATLVTNDSGSLSFDVSASVLAWLRGEQPNYGWLVKKADDNGSGRVDLGSRESPQGPELQLSIDFDAPQIAITASPIVLAVAAIPVKIQWSDPRLRGTASGIDPSTAHVLLDGVDVTGSFTVNAAGATATLDTTGLTTGDHTIEVSVADHVGHTTHEHASIRVIDTPLVLQGRIDGYDLVIELDADRSMRLLTEWDPRIHGRGMYSYDAAAHVLQIGIDELVCEGCGGASDLLSTTPLSNLRLDVLVRSWTSSAVEGLLRKDTAFSQPVLLSVANSFALKNTFTDVKVTVNYPESNGQTFNGMAGVAILTPARDPGRALVDTRPISDGKAVFQFKANDSLSAAAPDTGTEYLLVLYVAPDATALSASMNGLGGVTVNGQSAGSTRAYRIMIPRSDHVLSSTVGFSTIQ